MNETEESKAKETHTERHENGETEHHHEEKQSQNIVKVVLLTLLGVTILAGLAGGAYYLGMKNSNGPIAENMNPNNNSDTNAPTQAAQPTTALPTVTPTLKTVSGGMDNDSTSFKPYTVKIPDDWSDSVEKTEITNTLKLTKGTNSITIHQAPMGGGGCLYPGDADQMMAQNFTNYSEIKTSANTFRMSYNKTGNPAGTISYTICQAGNGTFGSPTSFGGISVKTPDPADPNILNEIYSIMSSITKK